MTQFRSVSEVIEIENRRFIYSVIQDYTMPEQEIVNERILYVGKEYKTKEELRDYLISSINLTAR